MSRLVAASCALLFAAGCERAPRSASFFESNPTVADQVLAACQHGTHRGAECENAKAARIKRQAEARKEMFRRGFEP